MNRKHRRALREAMLSNGFTQRQIDFILGEQKHDDPPLKNGDQVMLNADQITGHRDFGNYSRAYRDFIEAHRDTVFTVQIEKKREGQLYPAVCFVEDTKHPKWIFVQSDLRKVQSGEGLET